MRKYLIIFLAWFFVSADIIKISHFQKDDTNSKIKAAFLYSFTRYFEWPNTNGNFVIAIYGDHQNLINELNKMAISKMVGSQKIEIRHPQSIKELDKANILYILPDKSGSLAEAAGKFKGKGTLIITEKEGLAKVGSTINFIVQENKQNFELNKGNATKAGLKVSKNLDALAATVIN
jgi:hypothetical protein